MSEIKYDQDGMHELVLHIDEFGEGLSDWEKDFIADLVDNERFVYSDKQKKVINRIYDGKC